MGASAGLHAEEWAWWGLKSYSRELAPGSSDVPLPDPA